MTPLLFDDLRRDEGCTLHCIPDPITKGPPWTIGYGHTGPEVHPGLVWTLDQCETALQADVSAAVSGLDRNLPWWRTLDDVRQDALANMAFNMGNARLRGFVRFLTALKAHDFPNASAEMLDSLWARQVKARATRLAGMIRTGQRA